LAVSSIILVLHLALAYNASMNCPQCGADTRPGQKFCGRCGSTLVATTTTESPPSPAESDPTPPTTSQEQIAFYSPPSSTPDPATPVEAPSLQYTPPHPPRARSRLPLVLGIIVALILFPVVAYLMLTASRGSTLGSATPTPIPIDPEATLRQAAEAMSAVKTLSYRTEVGAFGVELPDPSAAPPLTITVQGQVFYPSTFSLDANIPDLGQQITIGENTWRRRTSSDPWEQQNTSDSSLALVNPLLLTSYLNYVKPGTAQLISSTDQGGKTLHRIRFLVDTERMAADTEDEATRLTLNVSQISMDAWIRDGDYLLDHSILSVERTGQGLLLRTTFSGYDEPVNIAPPE